jgi:hypothetical protein
MRLETALQDTVPDPAVTLKSRSAGSGKGGCPQASYSRLRSLPGEGGTPGRVLWIAARNPRICLFTEIIDFPYNFACHKRRGFL